MFQLPKTDSEFILEKIRNTKVEPTDNIHKEADDCIV